jgi:hypothetical protein
MAQWVQQQPWGTHTEGSALTRWLLRLEAWRYSAQPDKDSLGTLRSELRQLRWPTL